MNHNSYTAGYVTRWHTWPTMRPQTNAEHSHGVAQAIIALTGGKCSVDLIAAALNHDLGEGAVGDMRHPFKRDNPAMAAQIDVAEEKERLRLGIAPFNITEREAKILKLADRLEPLAYVSLWLPAARKHPDFIGEPMALAHMAQDIGLRDGIVHEILGKWRAKP